MVDTPVHARDTELFTSWKVNVTACGENSQHFIALPQ